MNLKDMPLDELRAKWTEKWQRIPHARIGRTMLEKSLSFKIKEQEGHGLTHEQQKRLDQFIKQYKRNPKCFDEANATLKPGTRLVRSWKGERHVVTVKTSGFDYQGEHYGSLSKVANTITGTRWNGRVFFGLKKKF